MEQKFLFDNVVLFKGCIMLAAGQKQHRPSLVIKRYRLCEGQHVASNSSNLNLLDYGAYLKQGPTIYQLQMARV